MENDELSEFFAWIEGQTFEMRKQQGRLSTVPERERILSFQNLVDLLRVPFDTVEMTYKVMRKQHRDPTLPELADRIREEETKRLDSVLALEKYKLIKQVHRDTLVRKSDIITVYDSMLDVNARLPTRETLSLRVRETYYNQYPHLRVKALIERTATSTR